jgi:3-phosphoshikimate 1-carboxyvinyltransferase
VTATIPTVDTWPSPWPAPQAPVPIRATVRVPGSKSETNRALLLAALADGPSTIRNGLDARDTRLMRDALRALGVRIDESDTSWVVTPPSVLRAAAEIDCGLAGTVMRFVPVLAALTEGPTRFVGDREASARPIRPLLAALRELGVAVDGDALPFTVTGGDQVRGGEVGVDATASSQFVSALLLVGARLPDGLDLWVEGDKVPSLPHIAMTVVMLRERGVTVETNADKNWVVKPGPITAVDVTVAPDLSNAAPFLAAAAVTGGEVTIPDWPSDTEQPGDQLRHLFRQFGAEVDFDDSGLTVTGRGHIDGIEADLSGASELTPVIAAVAVFADSATHLSGIGHIRGHETDRLAALRTDIEALGGRVSEHEDGLTIHPKLLHSGGWLAYADHRMAQAGAVVGLVIDDVTVDDIACTAKTMPEFPQLWQDMIDAAVQTSERTADEAVE